MFIFPAQFYSLCLLFFLCEAARWAACLNESGFIKKLKLKHFNFNKKASKINRILMEMKKINVKWREFTHRGPPRPFWAQTRPRPHWSWPCPPPSLSCWTEKTHTPANQPHKIHKHEFILQCNTLIFLLTCPTYRHSEWRGRVQQQVQVILQHTATSIDQHLLFKL